MANYEQSVPGQMCRYWHDACINATFDPITKEGNSEQQYACDTIRDQQCGNETTRDASTTSATTSASTRPSSTASSGSESESGSATSSTASGSSSTPGAAVRLAQEFGAPVVAGGLIALFGIAL
jgi:hypothetical protein